MKICLFFFILFDGKINIFGFGDWLVDQSFIIECWSNLEIIYFIFM